MLKILVLPLSFSHGDSFIITELILVMGPGQKFLTWVGPNHFYRSGRVSHLWVWNISHDNPQFFPFVSKKISSGQVKKLLGSKLSWPLIYCGSIWCNFEPSISCFNYCSWSSFGFWLDFPTKHFWKKFLFYSFPYENRLILMIDSRAIKKQNKFLQRKAIS